MVIRQLIDETPFRQNSGDRMMKTIKKTTVLNRVRRTVLPLAVVSFLGAGANAQAALFGVHVVDGQGQPVAGAAVCVGLPGNYKQFGALFTDNAGDATVDVPNVPLTVTVSKTRFTGTRMAEPARGFNLVKQVKLIEGVPGPRCRAGSILAGDDASQAPILKVKDIDISEGVYTTMLKPTVEGNPSHYRVSLDQNFGDAKWQRFAESIPLVGELSDHAAVYLQLRRYSGSSKGWLEARSDVITVRLPN